MSFISLWLTSAAGHAWLLVAKWSALSASQVFLVAAAIILSLVFARCSRWMGSRPERLVIIALLVCLAHVPTDAPIEPAIPLISAVAVGLGLLALTAPGVTALTHQAPVCAVAGAGSAPPWPRSAILGFSLHSRPPPVS